jgi:hypothetical protein
MCSTKWEKESTKDRKVLQKRREKRQPRKEVSLPAVVAGSGDLCQVIP